ncbi:hypothetical protein QR77_02705 [Streptomyces sp. 150FB]|uniref:hypothetical protein n=1 Tax=Streptomyces sp. 150FB TaxID=1576605 RepID=UPI0005890E11|nr:hypothetical protein [Streptomyces sp. 150FB]KIF73184.1 hypothetical protein QR77_02705 [Streptomyces sp. 150FB]
MTGTPAEAPRAPLLRVRRAALALALSGAALSLSAPPAAADSSACTHHFSGPQICVRLDGQGDRNAVTALWTNPPAHLSSRVVSLSRNGRVVSTVLATRAGKALSHTWPPAYTGSGTELCVKFRGSARVACQTTR